MQEFIQNLLLNLSKHQNLVFLLLFIVSFLESFAFIGLVVPGAVFIVTAGYLGFKGYLNIEKIILWSVLGAVFADIASFYLGKNYGEKITKYKLFQKYKDYYKKGIKFFQKYGGISVFLGRFVGPIRPVVPFLAGLLKMEIFKFYFYAIASGILWGISYSLTGYLFGQSLQVIESYSHRLNLLIVIGFIILYFFYKKTKKN